MTGKQVGQENKGSSSRRWLIAGASFILCGIFLVWVAVPWGVQEYAISTLKDLGFREVSLTVEELRPWGSKISKATLADEKTNFSVEEIIVRYEPSEVLDGSFYALTIDQPFLEVDLKEWSEEFSNLSSSSKSESESLEKTLRSFIHEPRLKKLRLRNAQTDLLWEKRRASCRTNALLRSGEGMLHLDLNGSLGDASISGVASITLDQDETAIIAMAEFPDLPSLAEGLLPWFDVFASCGDLLISAARLR